MIKNPSKMSSRNWETNGYLKKNIRLLFSKLIDLQHRLIPIPIFLWKYIYRFKFSYDFFITRFYGQECFMSSYYDKKRINGNSRSNLDYWSSRESLYWHYWRFNDKNKSRLLDLYYSFPNLFKGRVLEIGFGIGRYYSFLRDLTSFDKYYGLEANYFCIKESENNFPEVSFINKSINQFDKNFIDENEIDSVYIFGGVLFYLSPKELDNFFLKVINCKNILILDEGADQDLKRKDNTIMFNFSDRIAKMWNKKVEEIVKFKIKKRGGIYSAILLRNN